MAKLHFQKPLPQSSLSHDDVSGIILICHFCSRNIYFVIFLWIFVLGFFEFVTMS